MGADDDTSWLDDEQQHQWRSLVTLLIRLPAAMDADHQRSSGLGMFEYSVLSGLSEAPDRTLRMSQLASRASSSLSRLSHVVARLERRRWVSRSVDPADGRFTRAHLTDEGFDALVAIAPRHVATVRRLVVDVLTPEQLEQLGEISRRITSGLDGCADAPCSGDRGPG